MKKIMVGILCIAMSLFIVACGDSSEGELDESVSQTENEAEDSFDNTDLVDEQDSSNDVEPESTVIIDTDEFYVEFQGIEEYSDQSWIVELYVENNSDNDVYLTLSRGLANGCMINFSNNSQKMLAGGKYTSTSNFDYIIEISDLQDYDIESLETLEFETSLGESILGDDNESVSVSIDMKKSVPMADNKTEDIVSESLYDANDIYIEYRGVYEYSPSSLIVDLYIENNGDSDVWVSLDDGMADGYVISFANSFNNILAGSKYLSVPNFDFVIGVEDLEAYGLETPDPLSFKLSLSTSLLGDTIDEIVVDSGQPTEVDEISNTEEIINNGNTDEGANSDDTVIDEVMERFTEAWSTPPTISSSELDGIITYSVTTSDNSSFYIVYSQDEDGTNIIKIAPVDLDETTGASDWMVVVGNMVYAVDEDITQSYDGMAVFSKVLDEGSMTSNGIYYYITDENNYFTIEF